MEGSGVYHPLEVGQDVGTNKPFLVLVVLDLGILLGKYCIECATFRRGRNKEAHLRGATDNQVEQCREEKVDRRRIGGLEEVLLLGKVIAWCIDFSAKGLDPQATFTARYFLQIKQFPCVTELV